MSIENFFETHPADREFAQSVTWERYKRVSPVGALANILINEGKDGLMPVGKPLVDALDKDDLLKQGEFYMPYFRNTASIYLGASLLSIEDIIREGQFDQETFNARLEKAHKDTLITPELFASPICEAIPPANYKGVIQTAMSDKTLASFFRRDFISLPQSMQDLLERCRLIWPIRDYLLPRYEERVKLLIPINGHQVAV